MTLNYSSRDDDPDAVEGEFLSTDNDASVRQSHIYFSHCILSDRDAVDSLYDDGCRIGIDHRTVKNVLALESEAVGGCAMIAEDECYGVDYLAQGFAIVDDVAEIREADGPRQARCGTAEIDAKSAVTFRGGNPVAKGGVLLPLPPQPPIIMNAIITIEGFD